MTPYGVNEGHQLPICSGRSIEMDAHILAYAAETGFYDLKSKLPLNLKKYQRFDTKLGTSD
jgi:hypothetical protein